MEIERRARELAEFKNRPYVTQQDLLDNIINIDARTCEMDMRLIQGRTQTFDETHQGQASYLLQTPQFKIWMSSDVSQFLLVDGGSVMHANDSYSPMSVLCTLFIQSLQPVDMAVCVYHFCGLHPRRTDPLYGVQGILRGILAQLLRKMDFDTSFIDRPAYRNALARYDVPQLIILLTELLIQVPADTVIFIVVDGVSRIENNDSRHEVIGFMADFQDFMQIEGIRAIVKILLTSAMTTKYATNVVRPENRVVLPRDAGSRGNILTQTHVSADLSTTYSARAELEQYRDSGYDDVEHKEEVWDLDAI